MFCWCMKHTVGCESKCVDIITLDYGTRDEREKLESLSKSCVANYYVHLLSWLRPYT